ncbi:MAG: Stp1/IreP family PP2C-type Ser/Thr phosphatase [Oscillospiraceae bacterium]|nr:Stp1/IreP family PP2C-type Ser/Thr phosphatase [Oscillospiraceae bacterium]
MRAWGLTDPGMVRRDNEDAFILEKLSESCLIAVVCDGMGGARSGDVASRLALSVFIRTLQDSWREDLTAGEAEALLRTATAAANTAVYEKASSSEEHRGMGTTIVAALIYPTVAYILNVGDSRAYHVNKKGIEMVTCDHSLVQMMVQRGELSAEEAKEHPNKNLITRAVGTDAMVESDVYSVTVEQGDSFLLCSDGLTNVLADQEILFEVDHGECKDDCCLRLLDIAKTRGAPDNVTVVLVHV